MIGRFRGFKTFDGAVETAVLVVAKSQIDLPIRAVIAEENHGAEAVRVLRDLSRNKKIKRAGFEIRNDPANTINREGGILHDILDMEFADALSTSTDTRVNDLFDVRLGMRGIGAEDRKKVLFLRTEGEFRQLAPTEGERTYFRPIADKIVDGRIIPSGYVFFPYGTDGRPFADEDELAAKVPIFYQEKLLPVRPEMLAKPAMKVRNTKQKWWEPDRPRKAWLLTRKPKIVSQEFGKEGNFAFDEDGRFAVVGGVAWFWRGSDLPLSAMFAYLALLNSGVFHRLLSVYSPKLQGLQCRLEKRFVNPRPLPDLSANAGELTAIGRRIHVGESYDKDALDSAVLAAYGMERPNLRTVAKRIRDDFADSLADRKAAEKKEFMELGAARN